MKLSSATSTKPAHCQIYNGDSNLENPLSQLFWLSLMIGLEHLNPDKMYAPYFSTYWKLLTLFPHNLQLDKLIAYELGPHILSWLHSYLADRKQHVVVGGESSPDSSVLSGVTQGSILGPYYFLFILMNCWCVISWAVWRLSTEPLRRWHAVVQISEVPWGLSTASISFGQNQYMGGPQPFIT